MFLTRIKNSQSEATIEETFETQAEAQLFIERFLNERPNSNIEFFELIPMTVGVQVSHRVSFDKANMAAKPVPSTKIEEPVIKPAEISVPAEIPDHQLAEPPVQDEVEDVEDEVEVEVEDAPVEEPVVEDDVESMFDDLDINDVEDEVEVEVEDAPVEEPVVEDDEDLESMFDDLDLDDVEGEVEVEDAPVEEPVVEDDEDLESMFDDLDLDDDIDL